MQDAPSVISAEAGIRKRGRFFITLHNTSWIRDHRPFPEISSIRGGPCRRRVAVGRWLVDGDRRNGAFARRTVLFGPGFDPGSTRYGEPADGPGARPSGGSAHRADTVEPAAGLAQWVEQLLCKHQVVSSSLTAGTIPPAPGGGPCGGPVPSQPAPPSNLKRQTPTPGPPLRPEHRSDPRRLSAPSPSPARCRATGGCTRAGGPRRSPRSVRAPRSPRGASPRSRRIRARRPAGRG